MGYDFEVGGVRFQAIAAENSAEGEDALLLWLPDHEILLTGDFYGCLYPMVPNLYTVRGEKLRDPIGYVHALAERCRRYDPLPMCSVAVDLPGVPSIVVDNATGMREVIEHLIFVLGFSRFAFIRGPEENDDAERRYAA